MMIVSDEQGLISRVQGRPKCSIATRFGTMVQADESAVTKRVALRRKPKHVCRAFSSESLKNQM
jgi:hypothetical protein